MNRKKTFITVGILAAILATGVFLKTSQSNILASRSDMVSKFFAAKPKSGRLGYPKNHVILAPLPQALSPIMPWDYLQPLNADEKREFKGVEAQIQKYLSWGKMDPESVTAFRQTLFKLGDRAVGDLARKLSQMTKEDIQNKSDAEGVVHKIDELAYFADSSSPLAINSVAALAKRQVVWKANGELHNPIEADITFEAFDIFAKVRSEEAANFIATIDKKHRTAYFTRYAYGRKLAGKTLDDIDIELKAVFGNAETALR